MYAKTVKKSQWEYVYVLFITIIYSILALLGMYQWMNHIFFKILGIILVSISIWVIYSDYRVNVEKEDGGIDG